jgi:phytanoyl-CoA dioxygenase PhyH
MFRLRRRERLDPDASIDELRDEIERLAAANRARPDRATERRLLRLHHLVGVRELDAANGTAEYPEPDAGALPAGEGLPEFAPGDLTPALLRAAILRDGCVLVRGLVDRQAALAFGQRIDRAFGDREAGRKGLFEEFTPHERFGPVAGRDWIEAGGGLLAADAPALAFEMLELFRSLRLAPLVDGYLGEPALISVHKTTLRKAAPSVPGAWHQDGTFMGPVRSLNLWLSLSRCGDEAPGLDIVPRRIDHLVAAGTDDAMIDIQTSRAKVEEAAGDTPIIRPIFEPGDALLFDELFLHQTASDPAMPHPRYAIENWFFGSSSFPADYAPIAPW